MSAEKGRELLAELLAEIPPDQRQLVLTMKIFEMVAEIHTEMDAQTLVLGMIAAKSGIDVHRIATMLKQRADDQEAELRERIIGG